MTDDSRTNTTPSIHTNHYCREEGCGKWGGFGFSTGRGEPQWWCWEHYPHKHERKSADAC